MGNSNSESIKEKLMINTNLRDKNGNMKNNIKDSSGLLPNYVGINSSYSYTTNSNANGQIDTHTNNYESDTHLIATHDVDPLINKEYKKQNLLTHRLKLTKSNSNSYLYQSDSDSNTDILLNEKINLLPKH